MRYFTDFVHTETFEGKTLVKSAIKKTIITGLAAVTVSTSLAPALANDKPDTIDGVKPIAATPEEGAATGGASLGYGEKSKLGAPNPQGNNPNERQGKQHGASFFSGGPGGQTSGSTAKTSPTTRATSTGAPRRGQAPNSRGSKRVKEPATKTRISAKTTRVLVSTGY